MLPAPDANPALLAMFRARAREPLRGMVPWAGKFAGKYLTHAVAILRLSADPELAGCLRRWRADLPLRPGRNLVGIAVTHFPAFWGNVGHSAWELSLSLGEPLSRRAALPDGEACHLASIYRGPLLLAFDPRFDGADLEALPVLDARGWRDRLVEPDSGPPAWLLLACANAEGRTLRLCDFASAGATGLPYRTWFNVRGIAPAPFSSANPLRSSRPDRAVLVP